MTYKMIPLSAICTNAGQPRQNFDDEAIAELAASIEKDGLQSPILIRPINGDKYEIVQGERRYRAMKSIGRTEIPAFVRELSDDDAFHLAVIENIQREQLSPIEEAQAFKRYVELGYTHEQIAQKVSKSRTYVTSRLRVLTLVPEIQDMIATGKIAEGHAKQILKLRNELPGSPENERPFNYAQELFLESFRTADKVSVADVKDWADKVLQSICVAILRLFSEQVDTKGAALDVCEHLQVSICDIKPEHLEFLTDREIAELPKNARKSEVYAKYERIQEAIDAQKDDLSEVWRQKLLKANADIIQQHLNEIKRAQNGLAEAYRKAAKGKTGEEYVAAIRLADKISRMSQEEFHAYIVSRDTSI